jgi:hypothetical protein
VTPEAAMLARDLVVNADVRRYYGPLGFFDDAPGSVMWTYSVGQLRAAFLEETYGQDTLQRLLERSPEAARTGFDGRTGYRGFPGLVEVVVEDDPPTVERKFHTWLRRRVYGEWLAAAQDPSELAPLRPTEGYLLDLATSPDGELITYTSIDLESGRAELFVADTRSPAGARRVAVDGRPGAESLHLVEEGTAAVGDAVVVWAAQVRGGDVLSWRAVEREVRPPATPRWPGIR